MVAVGEERDSRQGVNLDTWRYYDVTEFTINALEAEGGGEDGFGGPKEVGEFNDGCDRARKFSWVDGWARRRWIEGAGVIVVAVAIGIVIGGIGGKRRRERGV